MKNKKWFTSVLTLMLLLLAPGLTYGSSEVPVTPSGIAVSEVEEKTDQLMQKYIGKDVPGATITMVKDGEIIFSKGYGYADIAETTPMSAESTYLEAGSVSKLYTWTAVMQLVEQGKLDLDADIRRYLPEGFLQLAYEEPVTLHQLMSHTAGFEERIEGLIVEDPAELKSLETYLSSPNQPEQIYPPGSVIAYSNFGTNLAGYIVERQSGMSFETYIQKFIFDPLEMKHASFTQRYDKIPEIMDHKATGYSKKKGEWVEHPNYFINDMPAGSLNITSENMAHFMLAQLNTDNSAKYSLFEQKETLQKMHEVSYTHSPALPGNAHGFWERFVDGNRVLDHGGNTNSFTSLVSLVPEQNFGISILTNVEGEMVGARTELIALFIGSAFTDPQGKSDLNHNQEVVGRYRSARAIDSTLLKGISALSDSDTRITANNNGGITMSYPSLNVVADYVETEPYLYERISKENTPLDYAGLDISRLYFLTDANGKVLQLSYGVIADELPVTFLQTATFNYILLGVSGVLFLLGLILGGIAWRKKARQKGTGSHSSELSIYKSVVSLSFLGFLMIVNLSVTIVGLAGDPFQSMSNFNFNIVLFWIIGIAFLPTAYLAGRNLKAPMVNTVFVKIFAVILMVSFLALTFFLYSYNFFFLA